MGVAATRLPLAIDWPADPLAMTAPPDRQPPRREFVSWLRGGRATKKRTLDRTYLARAIEAGAKVLALHEATAIAPHAGGYAVSVRRHEEGRSFDASLTAPRVVLAAGTVNTVRLLLQYRATGSLPNLSAALGARFFTNGDFGALLLIPADTVAPDCGPPVTGWLDCWAADRLYLMEAGMVPGLSRTALRLLARLAGGRRGFRPLGWAWCFGVMGFDDVPGSLSMDSRGRMVFRNASSSSSVFHQRTMRRLRQLAEAAGATLVAPPDWLARRRPLTVHPLGGAAMADDPKRGVTDSFGEVFGYPGLFVADGSLLPVPTGCAPSMTIAALAERVAERIVSAP
jgi:cholesterol oxidase